MTLGDALAGERRTASARGPLWLRVAAVAEPVTLALLLLNRFVLEWRPLTSVLGPVHGLTYLAVIVGFLVLRPGIASVLLAWVPAIGGLLAFRFRASR